MAKKKTKKQFLARQRRKGRSRAQAEATWKMMQAQKKRFANYYALNPGTIPFGETSVETWFERDRAHVALEDDRTGETIVEWWDEDVHQAIEDGFLDPRDYHGSAYEFARDMGLLNRKAKRNSNWVSYDYGTLPPKSVFMSHYRAELGSEDAEYRMLLRGQEDEDAADGTVFEDAIGREVGFDADETWEGVKQLKRKWDVDGISEAADLASSILYTLNIEWI